MCSDFLADINNNHAKECRMDWGPEFVSGIKAIAALGRLLLVTHSEFDVSALEIPGSYDSSSRLLTIGEKVRSCSRLYQEAFAKSEQSQAKLSGTSWELASSRGSLHRVTELFRKDNPIVAYSSFRDEWDRVHRYLCDVHPHASACSESWSCLLFFIQEFETLINNMTTDNKKLTITLSGKLEKAKAEIKTRRYDINPESSYEKDSQGFDFTYAIPLLIAALTVLLLSGILLRAIILSCMFLCALLVLREGMEHSSHQATLVDDDGDQTRDLEIEIERLTQKHKLSTTIGQTCQEMSSSLASAIGGVREIHDSYRAISERLQSMNEDKIDRFRKVMNRISYIISWDESYNANRTTDHRLRESKDVTELRELVVELRLTFYIIFEWSSLYTRISQDIFTAALREVQSFSSLATLIGGIDLSSDRFKLRPAQQGQWTQRQTSYAPTAQDALTLNQVAGRAEMELNKLHREVNLSFEVGSRTHSANAMRPTRPKKAR
ncbi:uncharacterized protein FMAN_03789 [Fusarium mangiferae]|uniref:Uncharacterized protein n=1 Tax=Fusarium mangiferae TaxID=192010 RepID=A0A1L7UFF4_FUSMA|nr:uncharacterized protein FMAN_03789 [Fusarium mangiferae]CVL06261.1 uncharacterized protein FMAN_03789 [Fusarium mangiferae]